MNFFASLVICHCLCYLITFDHAEFATTIQDISEMRDIFFKIRQSFIHGHFMSSCFDFFLTTLKHSWIAAQFLRFASTFFWHKIVHNKVVIVRGHGYGFGCNPKYIALELLSRNLDCDVVWMIKKNDDPDSFPPGIRLVRYMSFAAIKELVTAKVWINNIVFPKYLIKWLEKKPEQVYIQTYHGAMGIKRIGQARNDAKDVASAVPYVVKESKMLNYLIANSQWEADTLFKPYFHNQGEICLYGHPRNDIFFAKNKEDIIIEVKRKLNIEPSVKSVFYIPTWRDDAQDCFNIDYDRVKKAVEKRFGGKWCVFVRFHPYMKRFHQYKDGCLCNDQKYDTSSVIDVTSYDDIQELLLMADAVITDYSSCIYDYVLSRKPGFIFATDLDQYSSDRGLYYPFEETPFSLARDNDKLVENILAFNEKEYLLKVEEFLAKKECCEDGLASKRVVDIIENVLKENK